MFSCCPLPSALQEKPLALAQYFATVCLCLPAAIKRSPNAQPPHIWAGVVVLSKCPQIQPKFLTPLWSSSFNWFSTAKSRVTAFYKFYLESQGELQGVAYQTRVYDSLYFSMVKRFTKRTWDQYWHSDLRLLWIQKPTGPTTRCFCSVISIPTFTRGQRPRSQFHEPANATKSSYCFKGTKEEGCGVESAVWLTTNFPLKTCTLAYHTILKFLNSLGYKQVHQNTRIYIVISILNIMP